MKRWVFDSDVSGAQYRGQGNHNLSVADVDLVYVGLRLLLASAATLEREAAR